MSRDVMSGATTRREGTIEPSSHLVEPPPWPVWLDQRYAQVHRLYAALCRRPRREASGIAASSQEEEDDDEEREHRPYESGARAAPVCMCPERGVARERGFQCAPVPCPVSCAKEDARLVK